MLATGARLPATLGPCPNSPSRTDRPGPASINQIADQIRGGPIRAGPIRAGRSGAAGAGRSRQFDDELVGLDPDDPDAQAFAAHLDRMQRERPAFTVEGYLDGVADFADSANRAEGGRRWAAVGVVLLLLAVVGLPGLGFAGVRAGHLAVTALTAHERIRTRLRPGAADS